MSGLALFSASMGFVKPLTTMVALIGALLGLWWIPEARAEEIAVGEYRFEVHRSGSGSPVILLESGALSGADGWEPVLEQVSELGTVIRYARPGEGETTGPDAQLTASRFADLAAGLLDALEVDEPIVVVGHSYGGRVAKFLAARHPRRVAGLLLLDPAHAGDVDVIRQLGGESGERQIARIEKQDREMVPSWPALDDIWSKRPAPSYAEIGDLPVTAIISVQRTSDPPHLLASDAGRIGWAMLHSRWVADFPRGRLVLTDRAGHFVQVDEPGLVVRELRNLIGRVSATP